MLASDADRDRVLQSLKEGYVQGRLVHEELDQRIAAALRARTVEELHALLDDLRPRPAPVPPPQPAAPVLLGAGQPGDLAAFVQWWPACLIGVGVFALIASNGHLAPFLWWLIFPAFFWFRGGRRRYRYRGPRF